MSSIRALSSIVRFTLNSWNSTWWKTLLLPGGVLFFLACVLFSGAFQISAAALSFYYAAMFFAGLLLAWRFHSGRAFAGFALILLAHRAIEFFASGHPPVSGPGRTALDAVSFLLALDFIWLALAGEFSFTIAKFAPRLGVLFLEAVFVAVICRPQPAWGSNLFRGNWLPPTWFAWTRVSQISLVALIVAFVFLVVRCVVSHKQVDAGFAWALAAVACAFTSGGVGRTADSYIATAGMLLLVSLVETSYRMAYHDELTGIPSRRALNTASATLESSYAVAVLDIDHFKKFNDTYGHDTGDEVLRMVARRLTEVTGSGRAFRVGGEEFTILFAGKRLDEVLPHLEQLRGRIEESIFRLRGPDRRVSARGPERRLSSTLSSKSRPFLSAAGPTDLKVTISIGVASSRENASFQETLERADRALYQAKKNGRNRIEADGAKGQKTRKQARLKD